MLSTKPIVMIPTRRHEFNQDLIISETEKTNDMKLDSTCEIKSKIIFFQKVLCSLEFSV